VVTVSPPAAVVVGVASRSPGRPLAPRSLWSSRAAAPRAPPARRGSPPRAVPVRPAASCVSDSAWSPWPATAPLTRARAYANASPWRGPRDLFCTAVVKFLARVILAGKVGGVFLTTSAGQVGPGPGGPGFGYGRPRPGRTAARPRVNLVLCPASGMAPLPLEGPGSAHRGQPHGALGGGAGFCARGPQPAARAGPGGSGARSWGRGGLFGLWYMPILGGPGPGPPSGAAAPEAGQSRARRRVGQRDPDVSTRSHPAAAASAALLRTPYRAVASECAPQPWSRTPRGRRRARTRSRRPRRPWAAEPDQEPAVCARRGRARAVPAGHRRTSGPQGRSRPIADAPGPAGSGGVAGGGS
jgi:hypothetical protein